jgi:hypothetical protein
VTEKQEKLNQIISWKRGKRLLRAKVKSREVSKDSEEKAQSKILLVCFEYSFFLFLR